MTLTLWELRCVGDVAIACQTETAFPIVMPSAKYTHVVFISIHVHVHVHVYILYTLCV